MEAFHALLQNALTVNATLVGQRQNDEIKRLTQTSLDQNEDVKRISAWAAILFAPTLVGTIYGMNFSGTASSAASAWLSIVLRRCTTSSSRWHRAARSDGFRSGHGRRQQSGLLHRQAGAWFDFPRKPKDPAEFSRRMEVLLKDEELRVLWRKWAKNYVKQYNYPRIADQYLEIHKTARKQPCERPALS